MRPLSHRKASPFSPCKALWFVALAVALAGTAAWGQGVNINSSPNVVGSGARALGMGGAFIAVADDATAASWNPGGLTQLQRPEVSLVLNYKYYEEDFDEGQRITPEGTFDVSFGSINYLSAVYPFQHTINGRNFVVSLNYQRKFDFEREIDVRYRLMDQLFLSGGQIDYVQEGQLATLSPAFGFELTDRLSMGVVVNIWDQDIIPCNEWEETTKTGFWSRFGGLQNFGYLIEERQYEEFDGINYTFGVLYKPTGRLSLGAVYHTKFAADVEYTLKRDLLAFFPSVAVLKEDRRIEFPSAWGVGIAYRFANDRLTLSADVTRRNWDEFVEISKGFPFGQSRRLSPITGLEKWRSYHEPTTTVRLGAEYVFIDRRQPLQDYLPSVRLGAFYDPHPAGGREVNFLGLGPVTGDPDDLYGVTFGLGLLIKNRVNLDFAYQYRWGDDVRKDTFSMWDVDADVDQHDFFLSTVIYF